MLGFQESETNISRDQVSRLFLHPHLQGIAGEWRTQQSSAAAAPGPSADLPGYNSHSHTVADLLQDSIGGTRPNWTPKKSVSLH